MDGYGDVVGDESGKKLRVGDGASHILDRRRESPDAAVEAFHARSSRGKSSAAARETAILFLALDMAWRARDREQGFIENRAVFCVFVIRVSFFKRQLGLIGGPLDVRHLSSSMGPPFPIKINI